MNTFMKCSKIDWILVRAYLRVEKVIDAYKATAAADRLNGHTGRPVGQKWTSRLN
jgi:hypothetical protein